MSGTDKAKNQGQGLLGKVKEAFGKLTGDRTIQNRGTASRCAVSSLRNSGLIVPVMH